jgi:hypothetical protein
VRIEHDPEKWRPVFGKDYEQKSRLSARWIFSSSSQRCWRVS